MRVRLRFIPVDIIKGAMDTVAILMLLLIVGIAGACFWFFTHKPKPPSQSCSGQLCRETRLTTCKYVKIISPGEVAYNLSYCGEQANCEYGWTVRKGDPAPMRAVLMHAGDYTTSNLSTPPVMALRGDCTGGRGTARVPRDAKTLSVGYYQSIMGLDPQGRATAKVKSVEVYVGDAPSPCSLNNFWRSISNIAVEQTFNWLVSQAAPFRNMKVEGTTSLTGALDCECYGSGGFGANSSLQSVHSNGNQQWLLCNSSVTSWPTPMWNTVLLECQGEVLTKDTKVCNAGACTGNDCSCLVANLSASQGNPFGRTIPTRVAPFLAFKNGHYGIVCPEAVVGGPKGPLLIPDSAPFYSIVKQQVAVITESDFDLAAAQQALSQGQHLLFTPGTYIMTQPLRISTPGCIVIGIGQPILQGVPAVVIDADNVTLTGVLLESRIVPKSDNATMILSVEQSSKSQSTSVGVRIIDVWIRHGCATDKDSRELPALNELFCIKRPNTYVENVWAWRADHNRETSGGLGVDSAIAQHIVHVYKEASNVMFVGLQAEHSLSTPVFWEGDNGSLIFLQIELPYEVTDETAPHLTGVNIKGESFWGQNLGIYLYSPKSKNSVVPCGVLVSPEAAASAKVLNTITVQLNTENKTIQSQIAHQLCIGDSPSTASKGYGQQTCETQDGVPLCFPGLGR